MYKNLFAAIACTCMLHASLYAQTAPTAGATTNNNNSQTQSREDRIRDHNARVQKLIEQAQKRRQEMQAQQSGTAPASGGAATPGTPGAAPMRGIVGIPGAAPGSPLPRGPVQPANKMPPPIQKAQAKGETAQGARSESRTVLLFNPLDSVVSVGDRFETRAVVETKEGQIDALSVLLHYPKDVLNPLALNVDELKKYAKGDITYEFDPENATIYVHANLKKPERFNQVALVNFVWEALKPSFGAKISYEFTEGSKTSGLYLNGSDLLGTLPGADDGVINTTVLVRSKNIRPMLQKIGDHDLIIATQPVEPKILPNEKITLSLAAPPGPVQVGDEFKVFVMLKNPRQIPIDRLKLYVQFDPKDLEVVDTDTGNVIKRGVNINDSVGKAEFPFNYYQTNLADNNTGVIIYEDSNVGDTVRGSGKVASITFRALHETNAASVILVQNAKGLYPTSDVAYRHESLLQSGENESSRAVALEATSVPISGYSAHPAKETVAGYNPFRSELARRMQEKPQEQ